MKLSIIIPCYNEGEKIVKNIKLIIKKMQEIDIDYNITIVNDGSSDNTLSFLNQIDYPNTYIESYEKNRGKGYAVKYGIESLFKNNRAGDYINFMDADLSTDLNAINTTLNYCERTKFDVIIGSRRHEDTILSKPQKLPRKLIGNACLLITKLIVGLKVKDTQCGFKTFKSDIIKYIVERQQIERFAFDVEYLYIAKLKNKNIKEIPIVWENDEDSKVSAVKSSINFFKDLIKIRINKKSYLC